MKLFVIISAVVALSIAKSGHQVTAAPSYGYQGPAAPLAHDGTVLDTPEVAQAKAAHLAAHAAASARASHGYQYDQGVYGHNEDAGAYDGASYSAPHAQGYRGPPAPLAHDGRVVDTPEVAHAKAAHLAAHAHAAARASHYGGYESDGGYRGQISRDDGYRGQIAGHGYAAVPVQVQVAYAHASPVGYQGPYAPLGHDGRVIDTPEVAQARAAHLQAYAHAVALVGDQGYNTSAELAQVHEPSSAEGPSHEESYY